MRLIVESLRPLVVIFIDSTLGLSVWPSGLGRTPLMREGPGSSPGAGKLDSGFPPERVGDMSSKLATRGGQSLEGITKVVSAPL